MEPSFMEYISEQLIGGYDVDISDGLCISQRE
jgi:hypothetical protein